MKDQKTGLIVGLRQCAEYLEVSIPTIHKYLKLGMPGLYIPSENGERGTWHFHKDNLDQWWKESTRIKVKNPERFIENSD